MARSPSATAAAGPLGTQERAVLAVLVEHRHRVVSRRELARAAGVAELSERRCDSLLVGIRRTLGVDAVVTVRSRGWMLAPGAGTAAEAVLQSTSDAVRAARSSSKQLSASRAPSAVT